MHRDRSVNYSDWILTKNDIFLDCSVLFHRGFFRVDKHRQELEFPAKKINHGTKKVFDTAGLSRLNK